MVEKFLSFLRRFTRSQRVDLFAIARMDEFTEKWSVIFAAPWINQTSRNTVSNSLWRFLTTELTESERLSIARIGVFNSGEPFIRKFDSYLQASSVTRIGSVTPFRVQGFRINGNVIHDAIVFEWRPLESAEI